MSSKRFDDVFHVLALIKRSVDETHGRAERALRETAADRALAEELRFGVTRVMKAHPLGTPFDLPQLSALIERVCTTDPANFHALCQRLIDDREALAKQLDDIRTLLGNLDFEPEARKRNQGEGARGGSR